MGKIDFISEIANFGTWEINFENNTTIRNNNWYKLFGYSKDNPLPNKDFGSLITHPDDSKIIKDELERITNERKDIGSHIVRIKH